MICIMYHSDLTKNENISDLALNNFYTFFNSVLDKQTPCKKFWIKHCSNPWFPLNISKDLIVGDAAWKKAKTTNHLTDWQNFRQQQNNCIRLIRRAKSDFYLSPLANTSGNATEFWRNIKSFKNNSPALLPPKICFQNQSITNKSNICEAFNHYLILSSDCV